MTSELFIPIRVGEERGFYTKTISVLSHIDLLNTDFYEQCPMPTGHGKVEPLSSDEVFAVKQTLRKDGPDKNYLRLIDIHRETYGGISKGDLIDGYKELRENIGSYSIRASDILWFTYVSPQTPRKIRSPPSPLPLSFLLRKCNVNVADQPLIDYGCIDPVIWPFLHDYTQLEPATARLLIGRDDTDIYVVTKFDTSDDAIRVLIWEWWASNHLNCLFDPSYKNESVGTLLKLV